MLIALSLAPWLQPGGACEDDDNNRFNGLAVASKPLKRLGDASVGLHHRAEATVLLEVGPAGYDSWQITDDSGSAAANPSVHDEVHAVGGQLGVTYVPWMLSVNFHGFYEFAAKDRFQGQSFGVSIAKKF